MIPKRKTYILAAAILALAEMAVPLVAQDGAVFRSDSRLVVLHATVLDQAGHLVTNMPQSSFRVYENGVQQELKIFRREDAPVSIGLVIDDSGSMFNKRQKVAAAAMALVEASRPDDEVSVIHFNEKAYLDSDFTHDHQKLDQGLKTFNSHGTTAMRDALRLGIEHLVRKASEDKKVLIVITDGEDNQSLASRDYVVKSAQQSGVLIYAIGILNEVNDDETRRAQHELDALTQATGGQAFYLKDVSESTSTAETIARIIRNQYTLAYSPSDQQLDGTFRKIEVVAWDRPQLDVIARSGYWANGVTGAQNRAPAPLGQ
jgi:VWFA-related protein